MVAVNILALFVFIGVIAAESVNFEECTGYASQCKVTTVRITPCAEAPDSPCKIKSGHSASIEFDYTTDFDAPTVSSRAYWATTPDLPLMDMETDSCKFTRCPIEKNKQLSFSQTIPLSGRLPPGSYYVKWRMTAGDEKECCFMISIKLTK